MSEQDDLADDNHGSMAVDGSLPGFKTYKEAFDHAASEMMRSQELARMDAVDALTTMASTDDKVGFYTLRKGRAAQKELTPSKRMVKEDGSTTYLWDSEKKSDSWTVYNDVIIKEIAGPAKKSYKTLEEAKKAFHDLNKSVSFRNPSTTTRGRNGRGNETWRLLKAVAIVYQEKKK